MTDPAALEVLDPVLLQVLDQVLLQVPDQVHLQVPDHIVLVPVLVRVASKRPIFNIYCQAMLITRECT